MTDAGIGGSFRLFQSAVIPVMVGAFWLLAALNLPIDSRAKQVAASLALMSNLRRPPLRR